MPSAYNSKSASSRTPTFELPALKLDFGNITDGTNIPPPPKSPVPKAVSVPDKKDENKENSGAADAIGLAKKSASANPNGKLAGTKRSADQVPLESPPNSRPGSLRRFFSRTKLNNTYAEGQQSTTNGNGAATIERPASRSGNSFVGGSSFKSRRSSGWFRRLTGGESRRSSLMFEESASSARKPSGPPPPMIPELRELEKHENSTLGTDLFKNIK